MSTLESGPAKSNKRLPLLCVALVIVGAPIWFALREKDKQTQISLVNNPAPPTAQNLSEARAVFNTKLLLKSPSPQQYEGQLLPSPDAKEILYDSGALKLRAWISDDPADGKRHPAVVYLHGNWVFEPVHWERTLPYRNAGFVALTPMLRGENGNPGSVEMFWGEVDDAVAAGKYLASLPYVDPKRVFLAGHSVGGTLVMLTAMVPSPYAAAASFSGATNQRKFQTELADWRVFDRDDPEEFRLRSPEAFPRSLQIPLRVYAGDLEDWCISDLRHFAERATAVGKDCAFTTVPGDHRSMKESAIPKSLDFFEQVARDVKD